MALLQVTEAGLFCERGGFFVDPWLPVERAIVTHAHSDHATPGSRRYLTAQSNVELLRARLGEIDVAGLAFGESISLNGVHVSLHPAGHMLGSAQVRIEHAGEVWVMTGDFKTQADSTCPPLEPLRCHGLVTEATFALPIYRWAEPASVFAEIDQWWQRNQLLKRTSVIFAYALGKSQRVLHGLLERHGPVFVHGAVLKYLPAYAAAGVAIAGIEHATAEAVKAAKGRALVVAPPSAMKSPWLRKFGAVSTALASGWMRIRGARRRRSVDRGFVLSDHADWDGLNSTITASGATRVWATQGYSEILARWLGERGLEAQPVATRFKEETASIGDSETSESTVDTQQP
ncbi:MAG TPA: ligase-associated DNA damage response exonuclease [Pirellulales bacterium]|nr:ligase-associated DNA damage response exonuclease [Pirellulales bacterium]